MNLGYLIAEPTNHCLQNDIVKKETNILQDILERRTLDLD